MNPAIEAALRGFFKQFADWLVNEFPKTEGYRSWKKGMNELHQAGYGPQHFPALFKAGLEELKKQGLGAKDFPRLLMAQLSTLRPAAPRGETQPDSPSNEELELFLQRAVSDFLATRRKSPP